MTNDGGAMTDEIEPALSAEEWRLIETGRWGQEQALEQAVRGDLLWEDKRGEDGVFHTRPEADHMAALMALANAALPDDSPYKLTWATWEAVDTAAYDAVGRPHQPTLAALAALIAALLPPEGDEE